MTKEHFQQHYAPILPHTPGIYRFYNKSKKIIYVGKAIDIKKRVSSYFFKPYQNAKTAKLVTQIHDIEYTVTNDEHDAFLLENSLIKHFKPLYNIALKDDKTYPYVVIKNEAFPRLYITRNVIKDGSEYLGPFTGVWRVRTLLQFIKKNIPLRTCNLPLTPESIAQGKFKVCLEYHLGNCKGPCEGKQSLEDYDNSIKQARNILKGNISGLIRDMKSEMMQAAADLNFEEANSLKYKIEALKDYQSQSVVVSTKIIDMDAASLIEDANHAYVNFMTIRDGQVLNSQNMTIEKKLDENAADILSFCIAHCRALFDSTAKAIIVPFEVQLEDLSIVQHVPLSGDKRKILDLSIKNAAFQKDAFNKKRNLLLQDKTAADRQAVLQQIQQDLHLDKLPTHIECFDNSNFQGSFPVAAMVCFKDGLPYKKEYRHFHIKTVEGINDFASMEEIVHRRYKRLLDEGQALPQLIIIDGGKGQLSAAMKSINGLALGNRVTVIGLAKREELIFFPGDKDPITLPYNGPSMLLIRRIRDEVHRFGITFHRNVRSKGTIKNELEDIKGIGPKIAQQLLQTFRSVQNIKSKSLKELEQVIGLSKASIIYNYFNPKMD